MSSTASSAHSSSATTVRKFEDQYALVSSLYGPGTIVGWYFTFLSVLVSWTLDTREQAFDSIDVDLVALLILPAIAAGHSITQIRRFSDHTLDAQISRDTNGTFVQHVAALEAPLIVTNTYLSFGIILTMIAASRFHVWRGTAVTIVGNTCISIEYYIYFSGFNAHHNPDSQSPTFNHLFFADFPSYMFFSLGTSALWALVLAPAAAAFAMRGPYKTKIPNTRPNLQRLRDGHSEEQNRLDDATPASQIPQGPEAEPEPRCLQPTGTLDRKDTTARKDKAKSAISWAAMFYLPLSLVMALLPFVHTTSSSAMSFQQNPKDYLIHCLSQFIPQSPYSITDLDQAVSATAGASVLAFGIYSAAKTQYTTSSATRMSGTTSQLIPDRTELNNLATRTASVTQIHDHLPVAPLPIDVAYSAAPIHHPPNSASNSRRPS